MPLIDLFNGINIWNLLVKMWREGQLPFYLNLPIMRSTTIHAKAIQNKLCTLSQDFFQKERASEAKKHTRCKITQTFLWKKCTTFHIFFSYLTEILFEDWKFFVSYKSKTTCSRRHKPEITICPVNTYCVFFILALEKEQARWLKTHNLFWKA